MIPYNIYISTLNVGDNHYYIDSLPDNDIDKKHEVAYIRKDALWKPTDEQMKALNAICCVGELSYFGQEAELIRLYQELKEHNELFV